MEMSAMDLFMKWLILGGYHLGAAPFHRVMIQSFAIMSKMDLQQCPFLLCNFGYFYFTINTKMFNSETGGLLQNLTGHIKQLVENGLSEYYGEQWLIDGIPKNIYQKAKRESDEINYEIKKNGIGQREISVWECINLTDCVSIVSNYGKNWTDIFEKIMVRPEEEKLVGGKIMKIEWLKKLGSIEKNIVKPTYSVSKDNYDFIKSIYEWLLP